MIMGAQVLVERMYVPEALAGQQWPFTVPCVRQLVGDGLTLTHPITFLVGENGSGKSTVVEALAGAFGLDVEGGRAGYRYASERPKTELAEALRLELTSAGSRMVQGKRTKRRGYFLRAETAFNLMSRGYATNGDSGDPLTMSHGEGFLTIFAEMFAEPGLYLMDEPEAALSFTSCLRLVSVIHELAAAGSQVICATHSPILAATPGADIVEIGADGFTRRDWADLELVDHWRRYLAAPDRYLRHMLATEVEG